MIVEMQIQQSWWRERKQAVREFLYGMFGMEVAEPLSEGAVLSTLMPLSVVLALLSAESVAMPLAL